MASLSIHSFKRSLFKRVCNTTIQSTNFGLVAIFGEKSKWMKKPFQERESGQVRALYVFLHAIEMEPDQPDEEWGIMQKINAGQPQAICALNVLEKRAKRHERWVQNPDYIPEEP